ncbi:hypothetical protein DY000_02053193 [Brassica cretica]|uniref:Nodulin-like domain-containing protein n=2 Tax=Brassica cretica TaxID=69181 RepID=A0ABQ7A6G5_BRACR|nr:hypothetical protein DY000_02053193 [Brassica cretica]
MSGLPWSGVEHWLVVSSWCLDEMPPLKWWRVVACGLLVVSWIIAVVWGSLVRYYWPPFHLLFSLPLVSAVGQQSITPLRFSLRAYNIGVGGFGWSVNFASPWWYCTEGKHFPGAVSVFDSCGCAASLISFVQKIPCGFSVVGAREEVRSWSCQPRLSYSVATHMEPVRFRGLIFGCLMYTFIGGADLSVFLNVCSKLFFEEPYHKERIIMEAKITGFCLEITVALPFATLGSRFRSGHWVRRSITSGLPWSGVEYWLVVSSWCLDETPPLKWWRVVACGVVDRRCRLGQSRAILLASLSSGCSLPGICFRHHFQSLVDKILAYGIGVGGFGWLVNFASPWWYCTEGKHFPRAVSVFDSCGCAASLISFVQVLLAQSGHSFGDASSLVQKMPCGFSVVGAREEVRSWSCQPRLSYSVATRMEPVRFRGLILGCLMYTFSGGADLSVFLDVCSELFFDEPDHKERIIGDAKITGFCLSK